MPVTPPWRRSRQVLEAHVGAGFVAQEAPALQATIKSAFVADEGSAPIAVEVTFAPGAGDRVVVVWRNRNVGFVPAPQAQALRRQLAEPGKVQLVADGVVYRDGPWWRVWVGPVPADGPPAPPAGYDELAPPTPSIFGFSLGDSFRRTSDGGSQP